jgi:hypothetical protein
LNKVKIYTSIKELIKDLKSPNFISLAVFKPAAVLDFIHESQEHRWNKQRSKQLNMVDPNNFERVKNYLLNLNIFLKMKPTKF